MKKISSLISIRGLVGQCGAQYVFLGFAPAKILHRLSFADILDEETGEGYQRPRNRKHSLDFKKYIRSSRSSTIPLTFNLRKEFQHAWQIEREKNGVATLRIDENVKCLAQVDCQHRLGELEHENISLAFMTFIGLDLREEMAQFVIINSKARGLSSSLTDYHETNLIENVIREAPHLLMARKLNEDPDSPWFKLIRYGGETTSGMKRRTSFRMMQKAIKRFLSQSGSDSSKEFFSIYEIICNYWKAVEFLFQKEWNDHRHHLIAKGVGLHSLTRLLGDIVSKDGKREYSPDYFKKRLSPLLGKVDWTSRGPFAHAGGQKGVQRVHEFLKEVMGFESVTGRTRL